MSLARELVELEKLVREDRLLDPFLPDAVERIRSTAAGELIVDRLAANKLAKPIDIVTLCLQALQIQHHELRPRLVSAELVATIPPGVPGIAVPTAEAIRRMLEPPIREVILLGYEVSDSWVLEHLADLADSGVDVIMICDRERRIANRIADTWPSGSTKPRLFHDSDRPGAAAFSAMHAKCLLVDGADLLVTSANFTFHGLRGNIEIGIRLSGCACGEARKLFSYLVEDKIVEEFVDRTEP